MSKRFNIAAWSMAHKQLVYFLAALFAVAGIFSYCQLGRMEDPDYTIRQMVITTNWPGATAEQVEYQITDKLEKQLQNLDGLDNLQSYSKPGQSIITVELKDNIEKGNIQNRWTDARNIVNAATSTLPSGAEAPQVDDHFDAVYGMIYALTADDGYSFQEMKKQAEKIRQGILTLPQTKKVELLGEQTECLYINAEPGKLMRLGIGTNDIEQALQADNTVTAGGIATGQGINVPLHIKDELSSTGELAKIPLIKNGHVFHLSDFATVERTYPEQGEAKFFYQGRPAIGIAVSMTVGENIMEYGAALKTTIAALEKQLPAGMELHQTVNQAQTVDDAIFDFVRSLAEALLIIFAVSLFSLGRRAGLVVVICIPFVLAVVFSAMYMLHIDLQRVSLGALIIGLGLLVDDAMIVVEMIMVKLNEGMTKKDAVTKAFELTGIPMLTGTLITCAGFIPVGFAYGSSSEFCSSLFYVITIALLTSWIVAGMLTPLLGYHFIDKSNSINSDNKISIFVKRFYKWYESVLLKAIACRKTVLIVVIVLFVLSCIGLTQLRQESFPASTHPELIVRLEFPEDASLQNVEQQAEELSTELAVDKDIKSFSYMTGTGLPRFVLTFDPAQAKSNLVEFIITARDVDARLAVENRLRTLLTDKFPEAQAQLKVLVTGVSAEYPVMLCVKGPNISKVRDIAGQVENVMQKHPALLYVRQTSGKEMLGIHLDMDNEKARQLGVTAQSIGPDVCRAIEGKTISNYQDGDETLPIILRVKNDDGDLLGNIGQIPVQLPNGKKVPLLQVAEPSLQSEAVSIFRKNRLPAIQVCADVQGRTGEDVTQEIYDNLANMRENLPTGYSIEVDGTLKDSNSNTESFLKPVPIMVVLILILLMLQLQNVVKAGMTLLMAPLGIIGVTSGLILTGRPYGFVVLMGILALFGIIIRNAVILIDQIEQHRTMGEGVQDALLHASVSRLRPIMLTAMAAVLAMVPLAGNTFWGPMAVAIGAGLLAATALTLIVLPVMYAFCYIDRN